MFLPASGHAVAALGLPDQRLWPVWNLPISLRTGPVPVHGGLCLYGASARVRPSKTIGVAEVQSLTARQVFWRQVCSQLLRCGASIWPARRAAGGRGLPAHRL